MAHGTKGPAAAPMPPTNGLSGGPHPAPGGVNRKKQKRREKQAAKQALEAQKQHVPPANNGVSGGQGPTTNTQPAPGYADPEIDDADPDNYELAEGEYYSEDDVQHYQQAYGTNGHYQSGFGSPAGEAGAGKKSRKKKKGIASAHQPSYHAPPAPHHLPAHTAPPLPTTLEAPGKSKKKDRIWNTSTSEERERIKEFWLSLGEDERKGLVKIEKEAVLRKMKEQQKHSCSCTVCGRKRTAIEEELEVLYDAYYEELEQYANHQQDGLPLPPPSRYAQAFASLPPGRPMMTNHPPPPRLRELHDDESEEEEEEEGDEEDYSEEEDEDYISDEEPIELPRGGADFFNFGNSLTVKGGILTVADDLLKNDGKKFIEMMEQLAERRMQREEEASYQATSMSHPMYSKSHNGHNHGPPPEEDDYDDEDDEEYDDEEYDEEEEEDEGDTMTEEQRMEEGRRMFQIFAARMFEQRVLTAYREKVAAERQAKLLEELAEEDDKKEQREAKKAKEAAKRKEKKDKQRQAKAEEKARKDAEKAAQEAEAKAAEEKRLEEQRKRKEEQRKKKEAERKAQEEEKQRKDAERLKRQQEERERQQEAERKAREHKAQEKKAREEAKRKEREEREAKEKEAREKKAQEDKERRERESKAKAEKDRVRKEEQAASTAAQNAASTAKKSGQPVAVALPPGLLKQTSSTGIPSPHVTPALPKAPTPNRPRQSSQQGSHGSSPKTPHIAPGTSKSMSPASQIQNPIVPKSILTKPPTSQQPTPIQHPHPTSPMPPLGPALGMQPPAGMGINMPPGLNGFPHAQGPMMPGMMGPRHSASHNMPMYGGPPQGPPGFRGIPPPGMHAPGPMPFGRGFPMDGPPGFASPIPGIGAPNQAPGFGMGMPTHSRQPSASFDKPNVEQAPIGAPSSQPISRPAPIQRPSSVKPHEENKRPLGSDVDELANHLGSKALLDDDNDDMLEFQGEPRRTSLQTPHGSLRGNAGAPLGFGFSDAPGHPRGDVFAPFAGSSNAGSTWGTPPLPFPMGGGQGWGNSPTASIFNNPFQAIGMGAGGQRDPRIVVVRRLLCAACKNLTSRQATSDGFHDASEVVKQADSMRNPVDPPIKPEEVTVACDIFGDHSNGGGSLVYKDAPPNPGRFSIKFEEDQGPSAPLGEIGSPMPAHAGPAPGFGARPFPHLGQGTF